MTDSHREAILTAEKRPGYLLEPESIPDCLASRGRWILWSWYWNGKKWTKRPIQTNGRAASSTDPATWSDFSTAVQAAEREGCGLGFVFNGDGVVGIDLDDCRDPQTGDLANWAAGIVRQLKTYAEVSPSETGVKLFVIGELPDKFNKLHKRPDGHGEAEIYREGRFFCVTGQRVLGTPQDVQERGEQLRSVYQQFSDWKSVTTSPAPSAVTTSSANVNDRDTALRALAVIGNSPGLHFEEWLKVGMALHSVDPSDSMCGEWVAWSRQSDKHIDGECERRWKSFNGSGGVRLPTLCLMADEAGKGWRMNRANDERESRFSSDSNGPESHQRLQNALMAATRKISEGRPVSQILLPLSNLVQELQLDLNGQKPFSLDLIDSRSFADADFRQHFLCKKVLVAGQPAMMGGQSKTLKTTTAEDLGISLASGTSFLGHFDVPEAVNVGFISSESGMFTLQRNAKAIAEARGIDLRDLPIFWGDKLPQICKPAHLTALRDTIVKYALKAVFLDPCYLMILGGDEKGRNASNVIDMGSILIGLTDIVQATGCTIILIHHNRKNKEDPFAPPDLSDLAFAGFSEWARQWLLIGRRERYEHGTGIHRLWLNVGGSAGHGSLWSVDINEGTIDDDLQGRCWEVMVQAATEAKQDAKAAKDAEKRLIEQAKVTEHAGRILKYLARFPDGCTLKETREACGLNPTAMSKALETLRESEEIIDCKVTKSNKQSYPGVKKTQPLEHRN